MNADKRNWVPVFFPMGQFEGNVNLLIKGENVVTAEQAKAIIDEVEKDVQINKNNCSGDASS